MFKKIVFIFSTVIFILSLASQLSCAMYKETFNTKIRAKVTPTVKHCDPVDVVIPLIKKNEGLRLRAYKDVGRRYAIGYGTKSYPGERITASVAEERMVAHVKYCAERLDNTLPWWRNLPLTKQVAMLDMVYNMGMHKVKGFKRCLKALKNQNWNTASNELKYKDSRNVSLGTTNYYNQVQSRAVLVSDLIRGDHTVLHTLLA